MSPHPILVLALLSGFIAFGAEVELRDKQSSKVVARFDPTKVKAIEIEGRQYDVVPVMAAAERKARTFRFPKIQFADATLREAVRHLNEGNLDAEGWKRPFNLVLSDDELGLSRINLNMHDATYYDVLKTIAAMVHCAVLYEDETVTLVGSTNAK